MRDRWIWIGLTVMALLILGASCRTYLDTLQNPPDREWVP